MRNDSSVVEAGIDVKNREVLTVWSVKRYCVSEATHDGSIIRWTKPFLLGMTRKYLLRNRVIPTIIPVLDVLVGKFVVRLFLVPNEC